MTTVVLVFPILEIEDIMQAINGSPVSVINKKIADENSIELTIMCNELYDLYMLGKLSAINHFVRQTELLGKELGKLGDDLEKFNKKNKS